ncbi:MAG: hypothetical protein JOZ43_03275 [Acidobacteriales bacterium]|nr:hypothetical protein [Terriglobales bacterium]
MGRIFGFTTVAVVTLTTLSLTSGCTAQAGAASGEKLGQTEAEQISKNIYIAGCHEPQPGITRKVALGAPNANGRIREQYGAKLVFPIQVTWSGSCVSKTTGLTNYYDNIDAKYTAAYYKDQFGNWTHTPYVGTCRWTHTAYQQDGDTKKPVPENEQQNITHKSCGLADTVND